VSDDLPTQRVALTLVEAVEALGISDDQLSATMLALLSARPVVAPVPRVTLRPEEAAAALGVSRDFFDHNIAPELRAIRRGRLKLYPVRELVRWVETSAARLLDS